MVVASHSQSTYQLMTASTSTQVDSRMLASDGTGTCANIKAAGITIYTVQVNTDVLSFHRWSPSSWLGWLGDLECCNTRPITTRRGPDLSCGHRFTPTSGVRVRPIDAGHARAASRSFITSVVSMTRRNCGSGRDKAVAVAEQAGWSMTAS